jgi:hypothetical protein
MHDIDYKITQDKGFIKESLLLRRYIYENDKNMNGLLSKGKRDNYDYDHNTHTTLLYQSNKPIATARLTIRTNDNTAKLPIEDTGFSIYELFPNLIGKKVKLSQYSKLLILPEVRGFSILIKLFLILQKKANMFNVDYAILDTNNEFRCRLFCRLCKKVGVEAKYLSNLEIPPTQYCQYNNIKVVVIMHKPCLDPIEEIFYPGKRFLKSK